jgi:pimeloyl-ACP methyl ester carboxylesterase
VRLVDWRNAVRTLEMAHGAARYLDLGAGDPVVLLHGVGFAQGAHDWFLNVEALAEHFRVLAPDFVGWGVGDRLKQGYSFARLVDFVREFQDGVGIGSCHVVGHSMGGWIASLLAYESPQRVDRLVLVGSGGVGQQTPHMMTEFQPPSLDAVQAALAARTRLAPAELAEWARYCWGNVQGADAVPSYLKIMQHMSEPETRTIYNTRRRLPYITSPSLVIWGAHDSVNGLDLGRETAKRIPHAELVILDCDHWLPVERPVEFNEQVISFLSAVRATT